MKRIARIVGIVVILGIVAALALPFLINANQFRPLLETKLGQALGRQVTLGNLDLSILSGSVTAGDLSISDDPAFSKAPFLRAKSLQAGVELMPLIFSRRLNVTGITVDQPEINLVQTISGTWNFSSLGSKSAAPVPSAPAQPTASAPDLTVDSIKISDGRLTVASGGGRAKPLILDKVNIELKNFSATSQFPFSLTAAMPGGATIKLDGHAGPINSNDAAATPFTADLHVAHLDLATSGVLDPSAGIAGLVSIDGSAGSSGTSVAVAGKLKAEQLKLVKGGAPAKKPAELDFALTHEMKKLSGTLKRADVHLGKAGVTISGTYRVAGEMPSVDLKLSGQDIPVTELAAFLPALNVVLPAGASIEEGTGVVNMTAQGPLDRLVIAGDLGLANTRLAKFDLASKLQVLHELSGIKADPHTTIERFRANVKSSVEGTNVQDVDMVVPSVGEMTGAGTVSPSHALDFKMRVAVGSSRTPVPFTITGTSEDPSFKPDVKGMAVGAATGLLDRFLGGKKKQ